MSFAQPIFLPGQTFAMQVTWGNYESANALGVTAAGVLYRAVAWFADRVRDDLGDPGGNGADPA